MSQKNKGSLPFMASFSLQHKSPLSTQEAFQQLGAYLNSPNGIKKWDGSAKTNLDPSSLSGSIKGKGFSCQFQVAPEAPGAMVKFSVELSFLLLPMKGKIQETIQGQLQRVLGTV